MRTVAPIAIVLALSHVAAAQVPMHVTGVRLDNAFRLVGSDRRGQGPLAVAPPHTVRYRTPSQ